MLNRPSFILFMTDQQQADMLGCAGDPVVQTPNIDDMARTGTRFDRSYVAMPSCMPNRASLLTSLYPSVNGVRFNGIPLPKDTTTFPQLLQGDGYHTGLIGKGHLQPIIPPYFEQDDPNETWWRQEVYEGGRELSPPYYGYDHVSVVTGHGDQCGGHYIDWLKERLPNYADFVGVKHQLPHNYSCPQAVRTRLPEDLYPTSYIAEQACAFLEDHANSCSDQPFLLVVSFPDPHHPFNPPGKYWDMYDPDEVILPPNFATPAKEQPHLWAARQARDADQDSRDGYGAVAVNEREAREAIALTYGMITMIDDAIGQVRCKLEHLGLHDNTVQMFTSDHGELLGNHGLMLKGPLHFQSLIRVPLIVSDPLRDVSCAVADDLVSSVDLGVSILDRAGLTPPTGAHGTSLFRMLDGDAAVRDGLLIEDEYQQPNLIFEKPPVLRTLITKRWRITIFKGENWGELYDLERDPNEVSNLWNEPSFRDTKARLMEQLVSKMIEATDRREAPKSPA